MAITALISSLMCAMARRSVSLFGPAVAAFHYRRHLQDLPRRADGTLSESPLNLILLRKFFMADLGSAFSDDGLLAKGCWLSRTAAADSHASRQWPMPSTRVASWWWKPAPALGKHLTPIRCRRCCLAARGDCLYRHQTPQISVRPLRSPTVRVALKGRYCFKRHQLRSVTIIWSGAVEGCFLVASDTARFHMQKIVSFCAHFRRGG